MIKTLIVDDNCLFRKTLHTILAAYPEIEIVGEAADGQTALEKARALNPDVVLMDIKMKGLNGLETTNRLIAEMPGIRVIILSQLDMDAYREKAQAMGASAYIVKKDTDAQLLPAIRKVMGTDFS